MTDLDLLKEDIAASIAAANDISALDAVRVAALGKKGSVTALMQKLGGLAPEERKAFGQAVNLLKNDIAAAIEDKAEKLKSAALDARLAGERVDITLTPRPEEQGAVHPISQTIAEMIHIFADMGFSVAEGPEIEDDFHNFTALNFPEAHPARAMHDTFYLPPAAEKGTAADTTRLLRTHTSTVQVHIMKDTPPPIRIVIPGRVYRSDYDQTHTPMFHQMEGLVIDTETNMSHLKGCLTEFCQRFFRIENLPIRLRPSFFPFTEPSAEVDIGCAHDSNGLRIGRAENSLAQKWMEVLGCGMVHPNVLKNCGIDPDVYQGFAFGMGVERFAMLKYGIPDLRTFFESDLRWLRHYGFRLLDRPDATNPL